MSTTADVQRADRIIVVMSDIEIGAGGVTDDYPQSEALGQLIQKYNAAPYADIPLDLVFNGDTFDLLKVAVDGDYPRHVTAKVALAKLARVQAAHPPFFDALKVFLQHQAARRSVHFTVGNHDPEVLFVSVQDAIRERLDCADRVHFPGFGLAIGDVWIEHGAQADPLFAMDERRVFVNHHGQRLLNLPWGSVGIIDVALPMHAELHHLDRLKPREHVLNLMPEFKQLVVGSYWRYWTRDYWRQFAGDPTRHVSWTMVKEIAYRFASKDADVRIAEHYRRLVAADPRFRVRIVGHEHEAGWWSYGNRKLLRTGAFRNEFMIRDHDDKIEHISPVYAEVLMRHVRAFRSELVEVDPFAPPPEYTPDSMYELLPYVREYLSDLEELANMDAEQAAQAARERKGKR